MTRLLRDAGLLHSGSVMSLIIDSASHSSGIIGHTVRLHLRYLGNSDLPATMIAKFPSLQRERRQYFQTLGMYAREVLFYRSLAADVPLNIPRAFLALLDRESGDAFLLLEDIRSAEVGDRVAGSSLERATIALDALAGMHVAFWESAAFDKLPWLATHDQAAFEAQYHKSWAQLQARAASQLASELVNHGNLLSANLHKLARLWQPPSTLIHRDFNLDNLLFAADSDEVHVIDWQLVRRGRAVFDIATFICWNLSTAMRREHETSLLEAYFQRLQQADIRGYSYEDYIYDYRLALLECLARIIAILGSGMITEYHLLRLLDSILMRTTAALSDHGIADAIQHDG